MVNAKMKRVKNLTGMRFGRLTVLNEFERRIFGSQNRKATYWKCKCDCGNEKFISAISLTSGKTESCSCLKKEATIKRNTKHGGSADRRYHIAADILSRCNNKNNQSYLDYGGRGIKCLIGSTAGEVYEELLKIPQYFEGATIDRKDPNGNYELENLRWATIQEQSLNKRSTVDITQTFKSTLSNFKKIISVRDLTEDDFIRTWEGDFYVSPNGRKERVYTYIKKEWNE